MHRWCVKAAKLDPCAFECSQIKQSFVPVVLGQSKVRPVEKLAPVLEPAYSSCLICGDLLCSVISSDRDDSENPIFCMFKNDLTRSCRFGVHHTCARVHHTIILQKPFDPRSFRCDDVKFALYPDTVASLNDHDESLMTFLNL